MRECSRQGMRDFKSRRRRKGENQARKRAGSFKKSKGKQSKAKQSKGVVGIKRDVVDDLSLQESHP